MPVGLGALWPAGVYAEFAGECGTAAARFAAGGDAFAQFCRVAGSTLPPAALAGTALLAEKSAGLAVEPMAGLPPLFFDNSCGFLAAAVSCRVCSVVA